ncbi:MAG: hypothetical protein P4L67_02325 [Candidatus Pacebacteria bacterium]|nr:hypothetical protein [Candidatus Paceibacterota bacterium]
MEAGSDVDSIVDNISKLILSKSGSQPVVHAPGVPAVEPQIDLSDNFPTAILAIPAKVLSLFAQPRIGYPGAAAQGDEEVAGT